MKNVLSVAPYRFLPASSGGQRAVFHLYKHLGNYVHLTCASTRENDQAISRASGFSLVPLWGASSLRYVDPAVFFRLRRLVRNKGIDTLLLEHPYMGLFGWLLKNSCRKRLVIRSHNIEALRFRDLGKWWWKILWHYEKWVHRRADFSFFITKEDQLYAIQHYRLAAEKTGILTYGMEQHGPLPRSEKQQCTTSFKRQHGIPETSTLLLFNGMFGYPPNDQALRLLMEQIYPLLLKQDPDIFLVICGKDLPEDLQRQQSANFLVLGFVPDIEEIFKAAEIFLNPIWLGGGIKTKLIEALAAGAAAVSFKSGAIGIPAGLLDGKLMIVEDQQVIPFAEAIQMQKRLLQRETPMAFYDHFNWDKIAAAASEFL